MRAILLGLGLVLALVHTAQANTVVVLSGPDHAAELDAAMRVVMASRGVAVASLPAPAGELRLERAAAAQRAAVATGADAAVWIDESEICAVTSDGHDFRHAPFSADVASARAFASIATSLLDEMMAPEPWAGFDVDVNITPHGPPAPRVAFVGPPSIEAPGVTAAMPVRSRAHAHQTLIEIGSMFTPITAGIEGSVAFPIAPAWRLVATAGVNMTFDRNYTLLLGSAELRHVGAGLSRHWDIGPELGYASADSDAVVFGGVRIARTWELSTTALSLAIAPVVLVALDRMATPPAFPGIYTSLRWQIPL